MTTEERPAPLVGPDVDLRDFAFMPLDVLRLRDSDLASDETPEACWAAVLLWCAAWHQVPAGSIPDNDQWLAKQCGYASRGRIDSAWRRVRAGALRGFVPCSDGRLYHRTVSEKALEAWRSKLEQRWRTECGRIKKFNQRHELTGADAVPMPELEAWIEAGCPQGHALSVPGDKRSESPGTGGASPGDVPGEKGSKGQGEGQGQGQGQGLEEIPPPPVVGARPPAEALSSAGQLTLVETPAGPPPGPYEPPDCPHQAVLALWAEVLPSMPQHNPAMWRGTRADHLRARWRETADDKRWTDQATGLAYLRKLFAYCAKSPFLMGRTPPQSGRRPFAFELEWLVAPTNWARVIEGKYHEQETA